MIKTGAGKRLESVRCEERNVNSRESASLDRYITGNYGEDQFQGEAEFEAELDRLLNLREKAIKLNAGFQVEQAEALLDKHCPEWREYL